MINFIFGDPNSKTTWFYTKMFLFMAIPGFGLFYTLYLAFLEDRDKDINKLARGALIIRILIVILILVILAAGVYYIMPNIEGWLNEYIQLFRILG